MPPAKAATSGRIFQNPVLEALTKTHIAVPLTIFFGLGAVSGYVSVHVMGFSVLNTVSMYLVGALFFTFIEYIAHRKLYHMGTSGSDAESQHAVHHARRAPRSSAR